MGLLAKLTKINVVVGVDHVPGADHGGDYDSVELTDAGSKGSFNLVLSVKIMTRRLASELAKVGGRVYTDAIFLHINTCGVLGIEHVQSTDAWAACHGAEIVANDGLIFSPDHAEQFAKGADVLVGFF